MPWTNFINISNPGCLGSHGLCNAQTPSTWVLKQNEDRDPDSSAKKMTSVGLCLTLKGHSSTAQLCRDSIQKILGPRPEKLLTLQRCGFFRDAAHVVFTLGTHLPSVYKVRCFCPTVVGGHVCTLDLITQHPSNEGMKGGASPAAPQFLPKYEIT